MVDCLQFLVAGLMTCISVWSHGADATLYGPGDTRLIQYSSHFCQGVSIEYTTHDSNNIGPSTVYVVTGNPTLSDNDTFNFSTTIDLDTDNSFARNWDYHLYKGSVISLTVCSAAVNSTTTDPGYVYIFEGVHNFESWKSHREAVTQSIANLTVTNRCDDGSGQHSLNHTVTREGQYYLLFRSYDSNNIVLSANVTFVRTRYGIPNDDDSLITDHCSVEFGSGEQCTVSLPFTSDHYVFLEYGASEESPETWVNDILIDTSCKARVWLLVVIAIAVVLLILICVVIAAIVAIKIVKKRQHGRKLATETAPLLYNWDKSERSPSQAIPSTRKTLLFDELTEMAIAPDSTANPHIPNINPNPPPSFKDRDASPDFGTPTYSTFKPSGQQ